MRIFIALTFALVAFLPSAVLAAPYGSPEPGRLCHPETICTYGQCQTVTVCR